MLESPTLVQTFAIPTAVIRLTISRSEMRTAMGPARQELSAALSALGLVPAGPWFSHHFKMDPAIFDFEIGVPVTESVQSTGRVIQSELPATSVMRTVYVGGYEGLGSAWGEFDAWITAQGKQAAPSLWESYLTDGQSGPMRTELTRPLIG